MERICHGCGKNLTSAQIGKMCHKCAKPHCHACTAIYPGKCCAQCMGTSRDRTKFDGAPDHRGIEGDPGNGQGSGDGQGDQGEGQGQGDGDGQGEGEGEGEGNRAEELSQGGGNPNEGEDAESKESMTRRIRHSMHKQSGKNIDDKLWSVQLTDVGQRKIAVIKAVKEVMDLPLKEAKDLVGALEATGRRPFVSVGLPTMQTIVNALNLMMAGAKVKVIPYGDHSDDKPKPEPKRDEGGEKAPRQFKVYAHFDHTYEEFTGYLVNQGLTPEEATEVAEDGRFLRNGEVMLTCLLTEMGIEVIDCDYLD